jgi:hypothetical protein
MPPKASFWKHMKTFPALWVCATALTGRLPWLGLAAVLGLGGLSAAMAQAPALAAPASAIAAPAPAPAPARPARPAQPLAASAAAQNLAVWIRASTDNQSLPFAVIDKKAARLHVFNSAGALQAVSPVLLGLAVGDDSVPGIGERGLSSITPSERTTPAGRFASEPGVNLQGEDIVWISYEAAISMHRVRAHNKAERRLQRLAAPGARGKRITYGCVNVPAAFYDRFIQPVFGAEPGVVYVLPETRPASAVFGLSEPPP